jgi:tetratricopeptide (TPR) repeat protein
LKSIAFHSKLNLQTREFHIHTGSVPEKSVVISEIFEKGQYITSQQVPFKIRDDSNTSSKIQYLKSLAADLHRDMIAELEMLFQIHEKIRSLKSQVAHFKLGSILYVRNILPEAIENFEQIIKLDKEFVPAYIRLAKCYIRLNDYAKAIEIFNRGLEYQSDFPDLLNGLGVALTFKGDYEAAADILQNTIRIKPDYDEANFNLGVVLFLSTLQDISDQEKAVVPSRVIRYIKTLMSLERYSDLSWQETFSDTMQQISEGNLNNILDILKDLQTKLITNLKIDVLTETFYLKFMYGGHELDYQELQSFERRISFLREKRGEFADYWNELGIVHIIQCRHLFLQSVKEFEQAVKLNKNYADAVTNLELMRNIEKGFLILLRAILK